MTRTEFSCLLLLSLFMGLSGAAQGADRHAGYYYAAPDQIEIYTSRARILADASASRRLAFVTAITISHNQRPYPASTVFFAKGENAEKLIIVSLDAGRLNTIFRVRAYLASLTAVARTTPLFRNAHVEDILTFFDLAHMLGFKQITVSDGNRFTHQVLFE
ncbi:MAG: molybdopterin-guanine dinucleotide biosynthesis protein A [Rhodospirillales bacterium]|nr:molybdopterin-guanine dinucleotide biosynthesis protein A [Rhodospirillales bacterium]